MSKKIIWIIVVLAVLAAVLGGWYGYKIWWPRKQAKIQLGLASDKFPWRNYTAEELGRMYPQIRYANVPTRVTPEETYAEFREALRTNNLELALEQLGEESKKYSENRLAIEGVYKDGKFLEIYREYPEEIEKSYMYESAAQYYFIETKNNKTMNYPINFLKDANGDWKMDSL